MSIYSDYKVGAIDDFEFEQYAAEENRRDRWERNHLYDEFDYDSESDSESESEDEDEK